MKYAAVLVPAMMVLGSCGPAAQPGAEATASLTDHTQPSGSAGGAMPRPLPGRYSATSELVSIDAPGMPAPMLERMKQGMASHGGGKSAERSYCVTPEASARGYEGRVKELAGRPDCAFDHFSAADGKLDAQLTCAGQQGMKSVLTMQGTVGPEASDVTMRMAQSGPQLPGGGMTMTMRVRSHRLGDCS